MTTEKMNTENMNCFLDQISKNHPANFNSMILYGAYSHKSKDLKIPDNVGLVQLPPYSPEFNPAEQIWNSMRKNYFVNKVFDSLEAAINQAEIALKKMASSAAEMC